MAVTIDTLKAAKRLREEGGFDERQATALVATFADGFVENLATKDDVERLEVSLRGDIDHLRGDMEKLEKKVALRTDLEKLEVSLRGDVEKTEAKMLGEMSKLAQRLTVRFGGAVGAGIGILVALDKLF